jgi:hypothetical protein
MSRNFLILRHNHINSPLNKLRWKRPPQLSKPNLPAILTSKENSNKNMKKLSNSNYSPNLRQDKQNCNNKLNQLKSIVNILPEAQLLMAGSSLLRLFLRILMNLNSNENNEYLYNFVFTF